MRILLLIILILPQLLKSQIVVNGQLGVNYPLPTFGSALPINKGTEIFSASARLGGNVATQIYAPFKYGRYGLDLSYDFYGLDAESGPFYYPGFVIATYFTKYKFNHFSVSPYLQFPLKREKLYVTLGIGYRKTFASYNSRIEIKDKPFSEDEIQNFQEKYPKNNMVNSLSVQYYWLKKSSFDPYLSLRYQTNFKYFYPSDIRLPEKYFNQCVSILLGFNLITKKKNSINEKEN